METEIITLTPENIEAEHICCAIGNDRKNRARADLKKEWLKEQFGHGFVFKKVNVRGKVFIEYVPAEYAWKPVDAPGYLLINCLWVSGRYKQQGHGRQLMEEAIRDAGGTNGLVVVSGKKSMAWMVDKKFFGQFGFEPCDEAPPYFELLVRRNNDRAALPRFRPSARSGRIDDENGVVIMYSHQCPFHEEYTGIMVETAQTLGIPARSIRIDTLEAARDVPYPTGLVGVYLNGEFITHEITTAKKFENILRERART